jgi:hypothetical protein
VRNRLNENPGHLAQTAADYVDWAKASPGKALRQEANGPVASKAELFKVLGHAWAHASNKNEQAILERALKLVHPRTASPSNPISGGELSPALRVASQVLSDLAAQRA